MNKQKRLSFNEKMFEVMKYYDLTNITETTEGKDYQNSFETCMEVYKATPKPNYDNLETFIMAGEKLPVNLIDNIYKLEILPEIYGNHKYVA